MNQTRRFKKSKLPFAARQDLARRKARAIASRRCPGCGALCRTHAGNIGTRSLCERCGN